jgi:hypothetical protein
MDLFGWESDGLPNLWLWDGVAMRSVRILAGSKSSSSQSARTHIRLAAAFVLLLTERTPPAVLFDDFTYSDVAETRDHGWTVRTTPGIPGLADASWGPEGVSFVEDVTESGNRLLQLTSSTAGDGPSTQQVQICHERKYLRGTYAARVKFEDEPTSGPDGDAIVETFFAISPAAEPNFSEIDFEYLPNGGWGIEGATLWVTTWAPWGAVRPKPPGAEFDQDNTSGNLRGSFAGWRVLVAQVTEGMVEYFVDGQRIAEHGNGYAPTAPLSINFNLWFDEDGLLESKTPRRYTEYVDWVYHEVDAVLTTAEVERRVAELRWASIQFRDTVPSWRPTLPSPCDL